jgi:hypothetical protein
VLELAPNRRSWLGREAFEPSAKLTNQLDDGLWILDMLDGVSLTETGQRPVASVISLDIVSGSSRVREYLSCVILPIALGTFNILYEIHCALRSTGQPPKKAEITSFWATRAGRVSGVVGHSAKPVFVVWTSLSAGPLWPSWAQRLV